MAENHDGYFADALSESSLDRLDKYVDDLDNLSGVETKVWSERTTGLRSAGEARSTMAHTRR